MRAVQPVSDRDRVEPGTVRLLGMIFRVRGKVVFWGRVRGGGGVQVLLMVSGAVAVAVGVQRIFSLLDMKSFSGASISEA